MKKGIDVSKHNGIIDWKKAKESGQVDFSVIRAGYGRLISQKDTRFEQNYAGCKENNIPVGCYWYSYAKSVAEIQTEAEVFLQAIKVKQFEYPVYLDFEESSQFALGRVKCSEMAKAFLDMLEQAGYFAGLYSSKSHLESYFTEDRYTVWVAHYGVSQTSYKYPYDVWQYSEKGTVSGLTGNFDMNYCYRDDFPEIIKNAGLNGFPKSVETPVESVEIQKETGEMSFGHALEVLKHGGRVARSGWNEKNQYIQLATCISYKNTDGEIINAEHDAIGNKAIAFVGTSGVQLGWLASQADMLAEDWKIIS